VKWYIKTCDTCQKRRLELFKVPPVHTHTHSIFQVLHCDTMEMTPMSNGCKYILHGRCALSSWPEGRCVKHQKTKQIVQWLYEDIIL
jgi:Cys-tRNA synthase (O-phospho-L-seryl-tRNA:Cys-tRNA synthase)